VQCQPLIRNDDVFGCLIGSISQGSPHDGLVSNTTVSLPFDFFRRQSPRLQKPSMGRRGVQGRKENYIVGGVELVQAEGIVWKPLTTLEEVVGHRLIGLPKEVPTFHDQLGR